ncbi:MAG: Ni/Fe hydrogenase subunit alpha, partial [Actinobacteria bacterium]|nr:Ni/Fe hydrogenase subunit alpha [Actinomycetota bacterium]
NALVPEIIEKSEDEIRLACEMMIRAYDPCISCSTHFLNIKLVNK